MTLGIYFHWPFCLSKCPYCDFNSHVAQSIDQAAWRTALESELDHFARQTAGRSVGSIFFGGGTPSLMAPSTVGALIERVAAHWSTAEDLEITLEANPGAVDRERFVDFRAAGVNRLSLGLQALNDRDLAFLGRGHDVAQGLAAVDLARRHFPRMSFDLIYARPGQSLADWEAELGRALTLAADHLSLYQLTIEPGTAFHPAEKRGDFTLPDDDHAATLFELTQDLTAAAGLPAYEISNHARPGAECRHNLLYWRGGDYVGVGPGAHGRLTDRSGVTRALRQHKTPARWLRDVQICGHGTAEEEALDLATRGAERLMMGLRLSEGLADPLALPIDRSGLETMVAEGFLGWSSGRLAATPKGRLILNAVIGRLLPALLALTLLAPGLAAREAARPMESGQFAAGAAYQLCFTPGEDCTGLIAAAIARARNRVLVQAYSFTSPEIAEALVEAHGRGVDVRAILDKSHRRERHTAAAMLSRAGIPLAIDDTVSIAHNKVIIIDDDVVITGSFNFTKAAQDLNAENVILLRGDAGLVTRYTLHWVERWQVSSAY